MNRALRCAMAAIFLSGCATTIRPPAPTSFPVSAAPHLDLRVAVAVDEQFRTTLEPGFGALGVDRVFRFSQALRESGVFKEVRDVAADTSREGLDLVLSPRLTLKYTDEPLYVLKAFASAFSFLILSPILPVHFQFEAKGRLSLRNPAGDELRRYDGSQAVDYRSNIMAFEWRDGEAAAVDSLIAKLVKDIVDDRAFFASLPVRAPVAAAPVPAPAPAAPTLPGVDVPTRRLTERANDFALVVGVEKYAEGLPDAQFAESDARAVREHLLALGVPERNMRFLVGQRALQSALSAYLEEWLPRNVKEDSRVFVYFSGHGAPDPASGQAFLVPWDGNPSFLNKTAYPLQKLYAGLGALKARQVLVALDSCFSGAGGRSVLADGARPLVAKVDVAPALGGKVTVFAAASGGEVTATLKESGHGLFTYYFLRGLGGEAADATGAVDVRALYDYLKPKVQDAASRQNRDQTPVLAGVTDGLLVPAR